MITNPLRIFLSYPSIHIYRVPEMRLLHWLPLDYRCSAVLCDQACTQLIAVHDVPSLNSLGFTRFGLPSLADQQEPKT